MPYGWIGAYTTYTSQMKVPPSFLRWGAIGTIAGAARSRVSIDSGYSSINPNVYLLLVGDPGLGKSRALETPVFDFLDAVDDINVLSGSLTSASATDAMRLPYEHAGIKWPPSAALTILASELNYSMNEESTRRRTIHFLTDAYSKKRTGDSTRYNGRHTIEDPCINILAGTTPRGFRDFVTLGTLGTGFLSRLIIVYADRTPDMIASPISHLSASTQELHKALCNDLITISQLSGKFMWAQGAEEWFTHYCTEVLPAQRPRNEYEQEYLSRKDVHIAKLMQILSLSEGNNLILLPRHGEAALALLDAAERNTWRAFRYVGTDASALGTDILSYLVGNGSTATLSQLLVHFRNRIKSNRKELTDVLEMLRDSGYLNSVQEPTKKKAYWLLTPAGIAAIMGQGEDAVQEAISEGTDAGSFLPPAPAPPSAPPTGEVPPEETPPPATSASGNGTLPLSSLN